MTRPLRVPRYFLAPWSVGFVLLTLLPLGASIGLSLTRQVGTLANPTLEYVGAAQYESLLSIDRAVPRSPDDPWYYSAMGGRPREPRFLAAMDNTLRYALMAVPLEVAFALAVALLLYRPFRGAAAVRTIVYLPSVLGGVATALVWGWLLNPRFGLLNALIRLTYAALDPLVRMVTPNGTSDWPFPSWFYSPTACRPALALMHAWALGASMLVLLAALRRIPRQRFESAVVDGAGWWARLRHVVLPELLPALLFCTAASWSFALQAFAEAFTLQNRAQREGLLLLGVYLYQRAFEPPYDLGAASAVALLSLLLGLVTTAPILFLARRATAAT